jgi:DNA mismatch repair protein MutS
MNQTPMMRQYQEAKQACGEALLLFRMGDFYELFFRDAEAAAAALGLTLTSRDKTESAVPMAGFPYHQLDSYLAKLIAAGFRVAICEQVEDPKLAKGIVRREVTRIVTPGTLTDDALLDPRQANYLAMVVGPSPHQAEAHWGVAWVELSTGAFLAATVPADQLLDYLSRISPREVLCIDQGAEQIQCRGDAWVLTPRPAWTAAYDRSVHALQRKLGTKTLEGFGFDERDELAIRAAGGILEYLKETQKSSLDHIDSLLRYRAEATLEIDRATWRSLEIARTIRENSRVGSLINIVDRCVTPMGSRKLAGWFAQPLIDVAAIRRRQDAVAELVEEGRLRAELRNGLKSVYDLERLLARVTTRRATPRDLAFIGQTLAVLPQVKTVLGERRAAEFADLAARLDLVEELRDELLRSIRRDAPLSARDGDIFLDGYHPRLDELRGLAAGGKQWIAAYQQRVQQETGIANVKVGFNKVFGYYLEVSNANRDKLPPEYIRKQTIKNGERFISPELKVYEEKILSADEDARQLEVELFDQLRERVQAAAARLKQNADVLAVLDTLAGLAELAEQHRYCRPEVTDDRQIHIVAGRHPVLDIAEALGTFVPNDTRIDEEHGWIHLITGPNMSGKSTYIRQVALIALLAQVGSFVPAQSCSIGVVDRIFARVGASDELTKGQSTFMVEMTESARILNTATSRSLVVLDEIGRGTSTYDGVSLAWAMVEYLHDQVGCRTLFATHYHELTELEKSLGGARNFNVSVHEWQDEVVFLHKIVSGAANRSWGVHVAKLAGVPGWVLGRAEQILGQLQTEQPAQQQAAGVAQAANRSGKIQLTLFEYSRHPLLEKILRFDTDRATPIKALQTIEQWKAELSKES